MLPGFVFHELSYDELSWVWICYFYTRNGLLYEPGLVLTSLLCKAAAAAK